eukprot:3418047-Alexandrium_andersonii.AAC.1
MNCKPRPRPAPPRDGFNSGSAKRPRPRQGYTCCARRATPAVQQGACCPASVRTACGRRCQSGDKNRKEITRT